VIWFKREASIGKSSLWRPLITIAGAAVLATGFGIYSAEVSFSSNHERNLPQAISPVPPVTTAAAAGVRAPKTQKPLLMVDTMGQSIKPTAIVSAGEKIYLLGPRCLWEVAQGAVSLAQNQDLVGEEIAAPELINTVPVQEFLNLVYFPAHRSIVVLDKSGDLFEYLPASHKWRIYRANRPFLAGQPDPEFMDFCVFGNGFALLDPERNQIWKTQGSNAVMQGCFRDVLPWRVKPGDAIVSDGNSIAFDDDVAYVIKNSGYLTRYGGILSDNLARQLPTPFKRLPGMRPTRLLTLPKGPLFVVERENNRVLTINKITGQASQFLFPKTSDLRGLLPQYDGFYVIDGDQLLYRKLSQPDSFAKHFQPREIDDHLKTFIIPVAGMRLPRHPGVYPGARRLYRYGVHEGLDLFNDTIKPRVYIGAPARAAATGKVVRADANFKDMTESQFSRVLAECLKQHKTTDHNEDLLRGCQVWLDHGNGVMTRYAHLVRINPKLKVNQTVNKGDLVGFIGVSGTGQDLPGRTKYPHLHFEIWIDGRYLGYGLTPAETIGVYENVFGHAHE